MSTLFPMFLKLDGRPCTVVGAGEIALAKVESLLTAGAQLRVIAPRARPEIQALAGQGRLQWQQRTFKTDDIDGQFLVIAATDRPEVNASVYRAAVERNVLCNSVDDPPNCDFYFPSVVARGDLQVAVSTAGRSPALAQRLRQEIDRQLPHDLGPWLEQLGELRTQVLANHPASEARKELLHDLSRRQLCASATCPTRVLAATALIPVAEEVTP